MSSDPSAAGGEYAVACDMTADPGGPVTAVMLVPDAHLQATRADGAVTWRSRGERPCFHSPRLGPAGLPAGWYLVEWALAASDGAAALPCLYPTYADAVDGDPLIPLPDPDADRWVRALVLLKYDMARFQLSPGQGPMDFQAGSFRLQRISRGRALQAMLAPRAGAAGDGARAMAGRVSRFLAEAVRTGIAPATVALFADYRRRINPDSANDYERWAGRFDTLGEARMSELAQRARELGRSGPLISILVPVYQTPERWLRRCVESVLNQAYPHWQLCLVDDASPDPRVAALLAEYAGRDRRITVELRSANGHISAASNSALALARGEFVALLDHDDELRPHALLEMAEAIVSDPDLGLLYSDEDKIDAEGRRFDPYFKPDWDPDLLRSQNYVCHFTCIRTSLVRDVGGFREGFEGSQDHDLFLRCAERLSPAQVRHIPRVLYHWRAIPGSTALTRDAKDYASSAGARAVGEHLERRHPGARVEELSHGHYRVRWPLPEPAPMVSLIIPTRDKVQLLRTCVESILERSTYPELEVVVVDNQSSDPEALEYLEALRRRERVRVIAYDAPFNYAAINNMAVSQCSGALVGLVNNDIEVMSPDWLEEMVSQACRAEVGAVGAMLYYPDDTIQHAGVILGVHGVAAHAYAGLPRGYPGHGGRARVAQSLSAVTGACLLVRRHVYEEVGGLDEALAVAFNDIDFCLRLRTLGYRNVWTPFAEMRHHESASRGSEDTPEKHQRFAREVALMTERWDGLLQKDPAYNPNLSLQSLSFELACPPR